MEGNKDIYQQRGYKDRDEYLNALGRDFCVPMDVVYATANLLGPNEDFDGLVIAVDEYAALGGFDE